MKKPRVSIVAAIGKNRALGKGNDLLWKISDDLMRLKALTMGHLLIMGRKTFDSIGRPLPGRTTIVVTRNQGWKRDGVLVFHSLAEALEHAMTVDQKEVFIFGGAQIYEQALPRVDRLYLTLIDEEKEADVFFPPYEYLFTKKLSEEHRKTPEGVRYSWITLEKP